MEANTRTFVTDKTLYGNVKRTSCLGLQSFSPVIELDDKSDRAYFGKLAVERVVGKDDAKNLLGEEIPLPMDVKLVGNSYLTQMGVPANQQEALMAKWLELPPQSQQQFTESWDSLNKDDSAQVATFIAGVMQMLESV